VKEVAMKRLEGKVALIFGAGQMPGRTVGNGRATAITFAREGARVLCVDRHEAAAAETVKAIREAGGDAHAFVADVTHEDEIQAAIADCTGRWGTVDILQNNVGISIEGGDAAITEITVEAFDRIFAVNLTGTMLAIKHTLPIMRRQQSGVITNISSGAAFTNYPYVGYKTSKAAVVTLTQHVAIRNAEYGIRANVILPGQMNTPLGVENKMKKFGLSYEEVVAQRDRDVPLRHKQGTGWDIANASLFLASEAAQFITGVTLPVDGGQNVQVGRPPSAPEAAEELASRDRVAVPVAG
jgi:NAD(P)-dependent dehydrogenase (short-subunit alcohol dehydrogenase family)